MKTVNDQAGSIIARRLAVCSWSLQPAGPEDLAAKLTATGIRRVQLALDPRRENPAAWHHFQSAFQSAGIEIVSGMFGCVGEDYSTLESIRHTGGITPDHNWPQNLQNIQSVASQASELGLRLVTFHAGFLPHEPTEPAYARMLERLRIIAEIFARKNIALGLETGQETAQALGAMLEVLGQPNMGVNFDPANMILYDKGNPIEALRLLAPWIRQIHIKDAIRTLIPGTWGSEVAVGTGQVDWKGFFTTLSEIQFAGNFVIEREAGIDRIADICRARDVVLEKFC